MAKKHVVVTSRGLKIDMDALKKSQPNAVRIVTGLGKEKPTPKAATKSIKVNNIKPRIKGTIPAVHPKESQFLPINVVPPVPETADAPSPVVAPEPSIVEKVEEAEKEIKEFEKNHRKKA